MKTGPYAIAYSKNWKVPNEFGEHTKINSINDRETGYFRLNYIKKKKPSRCSRMG
jgi:hypothetical protein